MVSGLTVMIALAGLFLTGYSVFTGIGLGTIAVVGVTVAGSLTFLPALLSWLGSWADRGRIPFLGRRRTASRPSRLWAGLVRRVVRRPAVWGVLAVAGMLALAAPAVGMRLGNPPDGGFPASLPIVKAADRIQQAFPQSPSPAQVVVTGQALDSPAARQRPRRAGALGLGARRHPAAGHRRRRRRRPRAGRERAARGQRQERGILPGAARPARARPAGHARPGHGLSYAVTGDTANNYDDIADLHSRTPLVLAAVSVLAFVLLLVAFRSVAIPLISVGLNLLSVGAAYGLVTLIFQDGHLQSLLGFTSYGAIVPWIPLFLFVFLFGLSMDYHVFILSRVRELRAGGASTREAVVGGIASSAGVVTSAAVIMVAVFSILATLSIIDLKMLGIGLAVAVLLDATVVRGILVPAALAMLGERSWWVPRWLGWLPGRPVPAAPAPAVAAAPARPGEVVRQA